MRVPVAVLAAFVLMPALPWPGAQASAQHQCSYCHDVHGGVVGSSAALNREAVIDDMCLTCHSDAGVGYTVTGQGVVKAVNTASLSVTVHAGPKHAPADTTHCWDCHDHQGEAGANSFMIPEQRTGAALGLTRAVVFTDTTTQAGFLSSDGVGGATANGVCVVCHDVAQNATNTFANYNTTDGHNGPERCVSCHTHDAGFQGAGGGCTSCHNSAKGPRRVVTADFSRTSHHVTGPLVDADCEVCHDQAAGHSSDANGVLLFDHDGGASIQLTYADDPLTVSTEAAKLEAFCLGCHGDGVANGASTAPFSGAVTIPTVDETQWLASSHEGAPSMTGGCVGNGVFGCHGNGHGSNGVSLLSPYLMTTGSDLKEDEEGFCLGCHDADGPASSDRKTNMLQPINWSTLPAGLNDLTTLNDRHDIQTSAQAGSGAKIECVNCHNPHTATAAQPYILDPDTTSADGHVVGTDWYFADYQAAGDTLSEFCLDCHDGTFPAGVLDHTTPMVDLEALWQGDNMGAGAAKSTNVVAGLGYNTKNEPTMACKDCHASHVQWDPNGNGGAGNTTLFRAQPMIFQKGTTTPVPISFGPADLVYSLTDNNGADPLVSGGYWCNTCHNRSSMDTKSNCYGCHRHGDGRF